MNNIYFVTCTIVKWIQVFNRQQYFDILIDDFRYKVNNFNVDIYDFVLMDNHFHLIMKADEPKKIIKSTKSYTAKQIIKQLELHNNSWLLGQFAYLKKDTRVKSNYQIWKDYSDISPIESYSEYKLKSNYIKFNPVKAGYVESPYFWKHSSLNKRYANIISKLDKECLFD